MNREIPAESARNGEIPKFQKPLFGTTPPSALSGLVVQTFPKVRQQVKVAPLAYANRLVVELGAVVDAEILLAEQRPDDAFRMLSPYLDSMSRFQTRATAMRAARLGQRNADARIQHDWIRQHRGLAYAEIECGYCLQPLNLVDLRTAEDSWIAEAQG